MSAFQNWLVVGADLGRPQGEASFAPTPANFERALWNWKIFATNNRNVV